MTQHWNTSEIVKLCEGIDGTSITLQGHGGDWDTNEVTISFDHLKGDHTDGLFVQGHGAFWSNIPGFTDAERDDVDVEGVVLRNYHSDSDGGIQTEDPKIAAAGAIIRGRLKKAGFHIARHYDQLA